MQLEKKYDPQGSEARIRAEWEDTGIYHFDTAGEGAVFSVDTPPATVSGSLHLGHVYSYSQSDFIARYRRMRGDRVFYPMGFDDNGLPTERLVQKERGLDPSKMARADFEAACKERAAVYGSAYRELWQRLGLSVDWRHTYRTIDDRSQRISQWSFLDLHQKGLVYRSKAPAIWCPECGTAVAQADLDELERQSEYVFLSFATESGPLPIATTRPELLPACVAVFVHPEDGRFRHLVGKQATVPRLGRQVPILADAGADPEKGTGAVMCCTFGDAADLDWWRKYGLDLVEIIGRDGRLCGDSANELTGLPVIEARKKILAVLTEDGLVTGREPTVQTIRVHERCDTPVEYVVADQWFVRVLEFIEPLLEAGESIRWHPPHMIEVYRQWVLNLKWDWCISRQRYYGVPLPVWYCAGCGEAMVAKESQLPIDPREQRPEHPCSACGGEEFTPETDVLDTWATSSLSPQICAGWGMDDQLYAQTVPMALRPQAHEIIRTWAFYTILKSHHHFGMLPWTDVAISGWGLAPEGGGKISKKRGGGPASPEEMMDRYSADAVRYWAACTGLGRDSVINEEKMEAGHRLTVKLWNVARFAERFPVDAAATDLSRVPLAPADRWLLSRLHRVVTEATEAFEHNEFAAAKAVTEWFFWHNLADNYIELARNGCMTKPIRVTTGPGWFCQRRSKR